MSPLPLQFLRPATLRLLRPIARTRALALSRQRHVRLYSNNSNNNNNNKDDNGSVMPHISEEVNKMREVMGEEKIDVEEVGTPVQEIIEREGAEDTAPTVVKEQIERERREKEATASVRGNMGPLFARPANEAAPARTEEQQIQAITEAEEPAAEVKVHSEQQQIHAIGQMERAVTEALAEEQKAAELGSLQKEQQIQAIADTEEPPAEVTVRSEQQQIQAIGQMERAVTEALAEVQKAVEIGSLQTKQQIQAIAETEEPAAEARVHAEQQQIQAIGQMEKAVAEAVAKQQSAAELNSLRTKQQIQAISETEETPAEARAHSEQQQIQAIGQMEKAVSEALAEEQRAAEIGSLATEQVQAARVETEAPASEVQAQTPPQTPEQILSFTPPDVKAREAAFPESQGPETSEQPLEMTPEPIEATKPVAQALAADQAEEVPPEPEAEQPEPQTPTPKPTPQQAFTDLSVEELQALLNLKLTAEQQKKKEQVQAPQQVPEMTPEPVEVTKPFAQALVEEQQHQQQKSGQEQEPQEETAQREAQAPPQPVQEQPPAAPEPMVAQPVAQALVEEQQVERVVETESPKPQTPQKQPIEATYAPMKDDMARAFAEALAEEQQAQELGSLEPKPVTQQLQEQGQVQARAPHPEESRYQQPRDDDEISAFDQITHQMGSVESSSPEAATAAAATKPTPLSSSSEQGGLWATGAAGRSEDKTEERIPTVKEIQLELETRRTARQAAKKPKKEPEVPEFDEKGRKLTVFKSSLSGITYPPFAVPPPIRPPIPQTPIPANHHLHHRYSPFLSQLIPLFQRHGEKAKAQKVVQDIIKILRTKPVPVKGKHLLVPSTPDVTELPGNPVAYLQSAVDSVAPLIKLKSTSGSGGSKVAIPFPIAVRRRRRTAVEWIMAAADARREASPLAERFAEECVKVIEGKSSAWEKRTALHRTAIANRANVDEKNIRKGKRKKM